MNALRGRRAAAAVVTATFLAAVAATGCGSSSDSDSSTSASTSGSATAAADAGGAATAAATTDDAGSPGLQAAKDFVAEHSKNPTEATERVLERLAKTASNAEFLATLSKEV